MRFIHLALALGCTFIVSTFYLFYINSQQGLTLPQHNTNLKNLEYRLKDLIKTNNIIFHNVKTYLTSIHNLCLLQKLKKRADGTLKNGPTYDRILVGQKANSVSSDAFLKKQLSLGPLSSPVTNSSRHEQKIFAPVVKLSDQRPVIAVVVISCNRVTVRRCLDQLLKYRTSPDQFPIIVSQDCSHRPTTDVILSYGDKIALIKQPDQSDIQVPPKEKKFKGYFKIARHYKWALNQIFNVFKYEAAIIVEDDLDVAPDFFEYFLGTYWLLKTDSSLWCVSAWNDNGHAELVDEHQPQLLYRTDFFPGLGWMLTKNLWDELSVKWPTSYWDDWIRKPEQRQDRACIRPEVSRTKTFGKVGVSNGLFFEKHLKYIKLNENSVDFTTANLTYLLKSNYDTMFLDNVYNSPVITHLELKTGKIVSSGSVRIPYHNKDQFKKAAKSLGLMDDFRSGVPRTAYRGIVSFYYKERRVYFAPQQSWSGYNITWS